MWKRNTRTISSYIKQENKRMKRQIKLLYFRNASQIRTVFMHVFYRLFYYIRLILRDRNNQIKGCYLYSESTKKLKERKQRRKNIKIPKNWKNIRDVLFYFTYYAVVQNFYVVGIIIERTTLDWHKRFVTIYQIKLRKWNYVTLKLFLSWLRLYIYIFFF